MRSNFITPVDQFVFFDHSILDVFRFPFSREIFSRQIGLLRHLGFGVYSEGKLPTVVYDFKGSIQIDRQVLKVFAQTGYFRIRVSVSVQEVCQRLGRFAFEDTVQRYQAEKAGSRPNGHRTQRQTEVPPSKERERAKR